MFLNVKDDSVSKKQFLFLKDRLKNFVLSLNPDYEFDHETKFDESDGILLIGLIITIPCRLIPVGDIDKVNGLFVEIIKEFFTFYENEKLSLN
ncbi:hypothetical protein [Methanobacterium formicicum]|jgi:hypothetical protein|uniref:Uncharacterized protein n=1 Tax=Methanobacterium formicicum TaxID=2162 RepID=A0A089ZA46_METFO|nr:hypothetical protein [Methanobacterium formicicum]AIS31671.1 hypothetical protein BRM9_0854 [Methanobacterium formicicum]CEL25535.1 hypothetical protein MB9_1908 [Methanobacterium formicicum]